MQSEERINRAWRFVLWFGTWQGQVFENLTFFIVALFAGSTLTEGFASRLSRLEPNSKDEAFLVWILVAISTFTIFAYFAHKRAEVTPRLHIQNIQVALRFELYELHETLKRDTEESYQMALMVHYNKDEWLPEIRYNMEKGRGKHRVYIPKTEVWMGYAASGEQRYSSISEEHLDRLKRLSIETPDCFADVVEVLVTPIFVPGKVPSMENVIAAIVIYSGYKDSTLRFKDNQEHVKRKCEQLGRLISLDYLRL